MSFYTKEIEITYIFTVIAKDDIFQCTNDVWQAGNVDTLHLA